MYQKNYYNNRKEPITEKKVALQEVVDKSVTMTDRLLEKIKDAPSIHYEYQSSKDGKWLIIRRVETVIKPIKFFKVIIENAGREREQE